MQSFGPYQHHMTVIVICVTNVCRSGLKSRIFFHSLRSKLNPHRLILIFGAMNNIFLILESLTIRRTNRRLTIFHKATNSHFALPFGNLRPVLNRTRQLNSKTFKSTHTSKDCYKYSFFPRTITDWNSLPDKIATIKERQKFK